MVEPVRTVSAVEDGTGAPAESADFAKPCGAGDPLS